MLGQVIITTLERAVGEEWTAEMDKAWTELWLMACKRLLLHISAKGFLVLNFVWSFRKCMLVQMDVCLQNVRFHICMHSSLHVQMPCFSCRLPCMVSSICTVDVHKWEDLEGQG